MIVVDDCACECLALITDTLLSGARVARELETLFDVHGKPRTVVSDIGTEFTSNTTLAFAEACKIVWHYIAPGKPYPSGEPHLPFQVKPLSSVLMDDLKVAHKYGGGDGA